MSDIVDARGLSCPQTVIMTRGKIKEMSNGSFTVIVDNETSKENVIRAAGVRGWTVDNIEIMEDEFKITFKKE